MWAYAHMKGWNALPNISFNFHDAHDMNVLRDGSQEVTVKRKLRERLAGTKQAIVIIGDKTKNLYRYVRWEIEACLELGIPIVAVNLNGMKSMDDALCPPVLKNTHTIHVPYKMQIIQLALDDFCAYFGQYKNKDINYYYPAKVYKNLGLD